MILVASDQLKNMAKKRLIHLIILLPRPILPLIIPLPILPPRPILPLIMLLPLTIHLPHPTQLQLLTIQNPPPATTAKTAVTTAPVLASSPTLKTTQYFSDVDLNPKRNGTEPPASPATGNSRNVSTST